jgi:tRNA threonylcarbamoyladenosine biosynthesis protein TsaE
LGHLIGRSLQGGEVMALYGELGSGKTTLVKGLADGLDAPPTVTSPTFVLIHEYTGRLPFAHADLYRLQSPSDLQDLGFEDYLNGRTVVAIEWPDRAGCRLPADRLEVVLTHVSRTVRSISFRSFGRRSRGLLNRVVRAWERRNQRSQRRTSSKSKRGMATGDGSKGKRGHGSPAVSYRDG